MNAGGHPLLQRCGDCGTVQEHWQDRYCTECWSRNLSEFESTGDGQLRSWLVYHRDFGLDSVTAPYTVGWVELREGPQIACVLTGDLSGVRAGDAIRVRVGPDVIPWRGAPPRPQLVGERR
jgi:uncharacterized OB-fold protein